MLDVATFQATFPEFAKTNPITVQNTLARAGRAVSERIWCGQWDDGVGLWTAHRLKQMSFGTSTASEPAKEASSDDDYSTTSYGREFATLRNAICGGFVGGGTW